MHIQHAVVLLTGIADYRLPIAGIPTTIHY